MKLTCYPLPCQMCQIQIPICHWFDVAVAVVVAFGIYTSVAGAVQTDTCTAKDELCDSRLEDRDFRLVRLDGVEVHVPPRVYSIYQLRFFRVKVVKRACTISVDLLTEYLIALSTLIIQTLKPV